MCDMSDLFRPNHVDILQLLLETSRCTLESTQFWERRFFQWCMATTASDDRADDGRTVAAVSGPSADPLSENTRQYLTSQKKRPRTYHLSKFPIRSGHWNYWSFSSSLDQMLHEVKRVVAKYRASEWNEYRRFESSVLLFSRRTPSGEVDLSDQASTPSIVTESPAPALSAAAPADTTFTVIVSSSTTTGSSFQSPSLLNTCQMQSSSEQAVLIEGSQPDHHQQQQTIADFPRTTTTDQPCPAMEVVTNLIDLSAAEPTEFTPATARRTATELMASRLPKIHLKQGRYRQGKPIAEQNPPSVVGERRPLSTTASSSATSVSVVITR